ncbi:MAG: 4-hydroxy-tetrahydrodipicolinate synthase [Bacteroidales bacterium]|jgi:4-hydroxy-tetrahydrodipicolinate synthase|nr:4-hydroxy-tetrahydrodipicolinate synthase [Bacteroidales bacterium]
MITNKLKGLGVALVTPLKTNNTIDFDALAALVNQVIEGGANYVVALGTTSETPTLSPEEKEDICRCVVQSTAGRVPVVLGLGGPNTHAITNHLHHRNFDGISAILSVTPYYNKPTQTGLYEHYRELSYHSPLPLIIYNVCPRTACNVEAETTLRLAEDCPNIIAIKEASGNMQQILTLIRHKPDHFLVLSGDDGIALPLMAVGADGLISVVANALPKQVSQMIREAQIGNYEQAQKWHNLLFDITHLCFKEGNPAGIKAILTLQGKIEYYLRLPLTRVSAQLQEDIKNCLKHIDFH